MLEAGLDGTVRQGSPARAPSGSHTNIADRAYFRIPVSTGRPFVSDVFEGRGFGHDPIVALSAPLRDSSGAIAGVVEGSLNLNRLIEIVRQGAAPGIHVIVLDRHDRVILSSDAHYRFLEPLGGTPPAGRARPVAGDAVRGRDSRGPWWPTSETRITGWS